MTEFTTARRHHYTRPRSVRQFPTNEAKIFTVTKTVSVFRRQICKPLATLVSQAHAPSFSPSQWCCQYHGQLTRQHHAHDPLYILLPSVNTSNCMNFETNRRTPRSRALGKRRVAELNKKSTISAEPQVPMPGYKPSELQHILSQMNPVHYIFKIHFNIILLYVYAFQLPSTLKCFEKNFVCISRNTCVPHAVPISHSLTCSTEHCLLSSNSALCSFLHPLLTRRPPPPPRPKYSPTCSDVSSHTQPSQGHKKIRL